MSSNSDKRRFGERDSIEQALANQRALTIGDKWYVLSYKW